MPKLTLFYNSSDNDSVTLKNYFDTINTDGVEVNGNEQLNTKGTFVSYSLDLGINSFSKDYEQSVGEGITTPSLLFESDTYSAWSSDPGVGTEVTSSATPDGGQRLKFTNLSELANGDVLYELITNYNS